jgi:uncharacterized membrane protein (DUF441 family)
MIRTPQIKLFRLATIIVLGIGILHPIIHFIAKKPKNEIEQRLFSLMDSYHKPVAGGKLTMMDLIDGLNLCYGMFFLFIGVINLHCLRYSDNNPSFIKGLCRIESVLFFAGGCISVLYFFWVPAVYFAVLFVCFAWSGAHQLNKIEYSFRNPKPLS